MPRPAVFLDRDGVINENLDAHVRSWDDFRFIPGALDAVRQLTALRVPLVIVTNQAIVARGLASQACLNDIHQRMLGEISQAGGEVLGVYACPHDRDAGCRCRKPEPGMLLAAAGHFDLDLQRSVFVGDAVTDLIAGQRVGCRTILVQTGRGRDALRELFAGAKPWPMAVADDLAGAVPLAVDLLRERPVAQRPYPVPIGAAPTAAAGVAD